jgi:hypothetical protein
MLIDIHTDLDPLRAIMLKRSENYGACLPR